MPAAHTHEHDPRTRPQVPRIAAHPRETPTPTSVSHARYRARVTTQHHQRILIVGGKGAMGRRLARAFAERGHTIDPYDTDDPRPLEDVVPTADIVMIAVPMRLGPDMVDAVAPHLRDDALLCDINSTKTDVCARMAKHTAGEALGLHPMFGPSVHTLRQQKLVVCAVRTGQRAERFLDEWRALEVELIESTPDEHDRMMALVQVLTHFSTFVMGEALRTTGVDVRDSLRFTSPIYRLELAFVGRLFAQSPDLYAEILMTNPLLDETLERFQHAATSIADTITRGDREAFKQMFEGVADYFADFAAEAMETSDGVIDGLVEDNSPSA